MAGGGVGGEEGRARVGQTKWKETVFTTLGL